MQRGDADADPPGQQESGAQGWLTLLTTRYADTPSGMLARELFDGDPHHLVALARDRDRQLAAAAVERDQALLERAIQDGDRTAIARLQAAQAAAQAVPAAPAQSRTLPGDPVLAQHALERGSALEHAAMDMPATTARNDQYRAALAQFDEAISQLRPLVAAHPDDDALGAQLLEANEQAAACRKYITPF